MTTCYSFREQFNSIDINFILDNDVTWIIARDIGRSLNLNYKTIYAAIKRVKRINADYVSSYNSKVINLAHKQNGSVNMIVIRSDGLALLFYEMHSYMSKIYFIEWMSKILKIDILKGIKQYNCDSLLYKINSKLHTSLKVNDIIDIEYFDKVFAYEWILDYRNSIKNYYIHTFLNGKKVYLHRFILPCKEDEVIDHINHNTLDNRTKNLRICTSLQNKYNSKKRKGKYKYKGIGFRSNLISKPWYACIGKKKVGYFETDVEAAKAYDTAAIKLYGEFAYLNFPEAH